MILHLNTLPEQGHLPDGLEAGAGEVLRSLLALVQEGRVAPALLPSLRLHLDWIQYRGNFREAVTARRATDARGESVALAEIAVDLRQVDAAMLRDELARVLAMVDPDTGEHAGCVYLGHFVPLRDSVIWEFNRLFWQRLTDWEAASGRGFEEALPSGRSDANHLQAAADSVADFWTLLRDVEKRGQLPADIFALEIGVGSGIRAALWLDRFKALDEERGTGYYPRLRFLLGDYSIPTLDRAMAAVHAHRDTVSVLAMDALNPLKTLSFLRYKILYVHLTNVYDNLPHDELVRRDGRLYLVEARAYLPPREAAGIGARFGVPPADLPQMVATLLEIGPQALGDGPRG
ncbi:MAG: hypothetical protein ACRELA_22505, partial [Candidatus Rokuibacteriota bacterium]